MKPIFFFFNWCAEQKEDNNDRKHEGAIMYLKHPEYDIQDQIIVNC